MSNDITKVDFRVKRVTYVTRQCKWCLGAKTPGRPCRECADTGICKHEKHTEVSLLQALYELKLIHPVPPKTDENPEQTKKE